MKKKIHQHPTSTSSLHGIRTQLLRHNAIDVQELCLRMAITLTRSCKYFHSHTTEGANGDLDNYWGIDAVTPCLCIQTSVSMFKDMLQEENQ
jgi:hypothetical protein